MSDLLDRIKGTAPASKPDTKSLLARIKGTPVDTLDAAKIANATQRTDVPLPVAAGSKMTLADLPHATPEEAAALRAQDAMIEPTPPPAMSTRIYDAASKALNTVPDAIANVMQTGQTAGEWFMRQPGARRLGLVPGDLTPDQVNALAQGAHETSPATAAVRAVRGARLPEVPGMEDSIPGKIATGLGYVGQAVASGGGAIPLGVVEGGSGAFVGTYEQAKARGANEDAAFKAGLAAGGVGAALGGLQMDRLLKINQASGGMLAKALEDAVVFGSVAGAQTALNETITKHATHEDILTLASLEDTAKKAGAEAGIGTIVGALSGAGMHALKAKAAEAKPSAEVPAEPVQPVTDKAPAEPPKPEAAPTEPPVRGDDTPPDAGLDRFKAPAEAAKAVEAKRKQIETPEFKAWFGDSKVVDESGKPLVVYHGTQSDWTVADMERPMRGYGESVLFLTPDAELASEYANAETRGSRKAREAESRLEDAIYAAFDEGEHPQPQSTSSKNYISRAMGEMLDEGKISRATYDKWVEAYGAVYESDFADTEDGGHVVMPLYANIKNPLVVDFSDMGRSARWDVVLPTVVDRMVSEGRDGFIAKNVFDAPTEEGMQTPRTVIGVRKNTQIKSATGNSGRFDPNNPDIRDAPTPAEAAPEPSQEPSQASVTPEPPAFEAELYHGSPKADLKSISSNATSRQFDNGTSELGAFFSPDEADASRYAGKKGKVYKTKVSLSKPYEMEWTAFDDLTDFTRTRDEDGFTKRLPQEQWEARRQELVQDGKELRRKLEEAGYDGIVVRNKGEVKEVASFKDVSTEPPPAPTPSKPEASEPVGIRNASMERTAAELGVETGKRGPKLTDQAAHDEAMRLVKADPETPRRLISELEASDRPPNKVEYAVLNIERRRIENERVKARDEYRNATPEEREAKGKRVEEVTAEFNRVKDVFARLGTRSGQSLQARAAMLADDYSLAQMEFELQRAKGDKPLTEADRVEVEQLYERVTKAREAVEALVADAEVKIAQSEAVRAFERTKRQAARGASRNGRGSIETWIERKANEARERMKARTRTTFAGTDPQLLLDAAYIGADYIAKGVHKFSDWVTAMRADVPELTDADMREVYAHAVKVHEEGKQAVLQAEYDERAAKNPALKAAITRAKNRAAHLFEKAQYGDFSKKERRPLPETPDLVEARTELRRAQKEFERAKRRAERESMSRTAKALDATKQVVGAASDVLTSADVSAVLRQGNIFTLAHPIESGKHIAKMFQAFASEKAAEHIQTIIENDPLYPKLEKAGLDFTGYGDTLSPQEENIRSRLSKYIPFVAQSQRAFVAYMNVQRMARAKAMIEALPDTTPAEIKSIAEFVNDATGRGKLSDPRKDAGLELARLALFSPRLYLSRLNMLTMRPIRRAASPRQRKQAAIELGRYAAGLAAVSGLAWMLGADTEVEDPKKADFGKYRFGDTRLDMTGGLNQYITLAARMGKGETVQANGKTKEQNPVDTFTRFLRNKLNPPVGAAVDLIVGKNAVGEPTDLKDAATRMVVPLSVRDIVETMKSQGIPEGTAISILGLFGAGVQTYGTKK